MGRLNWNHASRSRWNRPWVAVGGIALAACLHALWWRDLLLTQRNEIVEQAQHLSNQAAVPTRSAALPSPAALDRVFAEMRYPWTDMLDSLGAATQPGVNLLTLEPDVDIRHVRIGGVANRTQDVLDLITVLQESPAWSSVRLVSQTRNADASQTPAQGSVPPLPNLPGLSGTLSSTLSFTLSAAWR
ncbi:PilN domain-containing protein [Burkholderia ambifaria]|jgi:Tfp pilus assembly protein PilN|uniref:Fimbrial assembly family protein n=1 Tax=Burkholderia ambifaria IOP40-10 TaxID=396596 RepID=B1FCF0_9BURK|nr:PilN domain-containing protein [Burkholderia ambifaria]EDT04771.1 Fimbrial assembly family protein [Burkholderia ambifaria IOP40-10]